MRTKVGVVVVLALVVLGVGAAWGVRSLTKDTSCTTAGINAQSAASAFAKSIPGTSRQRWSSPECKDGGQAVLRSHFDGSPEKLGQTLLSKGCVAQQGKSGVYTCSTGGSEMSVTTTPEQQESGTNMLLIITKAA